MRGVSKSLVKEAKGRLVVESAHGGDDAAFRFFGVATACFALCRRAVDAVADGQAQKAIGFPILAVPATGPFEREQLWQAPNP